MWCVYVLSLPSIPMGAGLGPPSKQLGKVRTNAPSLPIDGRLTVGALRFGAAACAVCPLKTARICLEARHFQRVIMPVGARSTALCGMQ